MRIAVLALTSGGAELARQMQRLLPEVPDVYVPEKIGPEGFEVKHFFNFPKFREAFSGCFTHYDVLICIMAAGIVVRTMAPLLRNKLIDPAVIVCDEQGRFAISLLSGHVGGANFLTRQLAEVIGAQPVITTATDIAGKVAPDAFAGQMALHPWPKRQIKVLNSALLDGEKIGYQASPHLPHREFYLDKLAEYKLLDEQEQECPYQVILCAKEELPEEEEVPPQTLYLVPNRLIAGLGCRKGVDKALVHSALEQACKSIGRDVSFIDAMASVSIKAHEEGLLATAQELNVPIHFYEPKVLEQQIDAFHLLQSDFVKSKVGVGNVCEAAALREAMGSGTGVRFALLKTKYEQVTVALLWYW